MIEETEQRERNWSELALVEQVERMRQAVKALQARLDRLEGQLAHLGSHEHVNGRVVTPYYMSGYAAPTGSRQQEWF